MKVKNPNYVKLIIEKFDSQEQALIGKELITTTEKVRMNSLVRDLQKYFENKNIWAVAYSKCALANISVLKYFIADHKELKFYEGRRNNFYYRLKFFDSSIDTLRFDKEKITQKTANEFIKKWCQEFDKGLGTEKDLTRDSFYFLNGIGGYSACDNTDGDCFCEDFDTEEDAQRYLNGLSLDEIKASKIHRKLKAYVVSATDSDYGIEMVFAENPNKAKQTSILSMDVDYIDLRSNREPKADKYFNVSINNRLDWEVPEHREILEKKFGWREL